MVPACSSSTLTNVLPHRNAMPQTQGTTLHPVTLYRHRAYLSLCYLLMWNTGTSHWKIYIATHFNVLGKTQQGNTSPNAQLYDAVMVVVSRKLGREYRTDQVLSSGLVVCESITLYPLAHSWGSVYK